MTAEMVAPAWMHEQVTAEQYATWTEEQCAGIEIVDGMVLVSPGAAKRHSRLARLLANALDVAAGSASSDCLIVPEEPTHCALIWAREPARQARRPHVSSPRRGDPLDPFTRPVYACGDLGERA
ncbi:hypothetical protein [Dactylosporangium sp. NPDC005555]|uniref:hypothetical protein n=1 Tax=Dactylosporangium sp. NPDC005555 TaxID=3154889 RepID=UPI0033B90E48